jgi:1-deoxyxylulose-5-phosphate synthase
MPAASREHVKHHRNWHLCVQMPSASSHPFNGKIAKIIFGASRLGDSRRNYALLDQIYSAGGDTFDTARTYAGGLSEECLGSWRRSRGLSRRVTIITKGGHPASGRSRLTRRHLRSDIEASLRALGGDALDLFLLHRDDPGTSPADVIEILNDFRNVGLIRKFGVSNWAADRIAEAQRHAAAKGMQAFTASSVHLGLAVWKRAPWDGCRSLTAAPGVADRPWYRANDLPLLAWSSLAGGFFSGRELEPCPDGTNVYHSPENLQRLGRVEFLARRLGASVAQIALAYVLQQFREVHAIVSCSDPDHFKSNIAACRIALTEPQMRWLNLEIDGVAP